MSDLVQSDSSSGLTLVGLAVAIVTLTRFAQRDHPALEGFLKDSLMSAERAGIAADDLAFIRTLIRTVERLKP